MEGPLSKWTNLMQGWQYRWFVMNEVSGVLSYYTSKEKMTRNQRRGCVRLRGAVVGIDDEDDSTFTITVDHKTFHFQGRDQEERDRWIRALEVTIQRHSGYYRPKGKKFVGSVQMSAGASIKEFETKISEADAYLQLMIEQVKSLEEKAEKTVNESDKECLQQIIASSKNLMKSIEHSIFLLQLAKNHILESSNGGSTLSPLNVSNNVGKLNNTLATASLEMPTPDEVVVEGVGAVDVGNVPPLSYSSDESEEYTDANSEFEIEDDSRQKDQSNERAGGGNEGGGRKRSGENAGLDLFKTEPDFGDGHKDFDAAYNEDTAEEDLGNVQEHGSVIMHLLSQVKIGMDLTKITLPTFILERRSLLEMIPDLKSPEERMVAVTKWYLSSFHAGRRSQVAKKPYNPILGETFKCKFNWPSIKLSNKKATDGPVPDADESEVTFFAEQVSHHPPISAFYAENKEKGIQVDAHIWTKSKFLGLSIGVMNIGQGCLSLLNQNEQYIVQFPNGYGRSILTTPWIELTGSLKIDCNNGYYTEVEFLAKPFYGGRAHCVTAEVYRPQEKTSFVTIKGQWNGTMTLRKNSSKEEQPFLDVKAMPIMNKSTLPVKDQGEYESRRLWKHVTAALKDNDIALATKAKKWLEDRQRAEAKYRLEKGLKWNTKHFKEADGNWVYDYPLSGRLQKLKNATSSSPTSSTRL